MPTASRLILAIFALAITHILAFEDQRSSFLEPRDLRSNFLRFGKRSAEIPETNQQESGVHKSSPRSFLRFGKRGDNFLRFGKRSESQDFDENGCTSFGDGYFIICRLSEGQNSLFRYKKARDFLRFGR